MFKYFYCGVDLWLGYDEGWSKSDGHVVSCLGEQAMFHQDLGQVVAVDLIASVELNSSEETSCSDFLDEWTLEISKLLFQISTYLQRVLNHALFDESLNSSSSTCHAKRVSTVCTSVISWLDEHHYVIIGNDSTDWSDSS